MPSTYVGKTVAILGTTNASPIVVTTSAAHGYSTGDVVNIASHIVNTAANGQWTITVSSGTQFSLNSSVGNGTGGTTGSVSAYVGSVTLQSDGDTDNMSTRGPVQQGLADRTAMLKADYDQRLVGHFPIVPAKSYSPWLYLRCCR